MYISTFPSIHLFNKVSTRYILLIGRLTTDFWKGTFFALWIIHNNQKGHSGLKSEIKCNIIAKKTSLLKIPHFYYSHHYLVQFALLFHLYPTVQGRKTTATNEFKEFLSFFHLPKFDSIISYQNICKNATITKKITF